MTTAEVFSELRPLLLAIAERFFAAVGAGDMDGLVSMLAADAVVTGDSGGVRPSWPRPIIGRDRVGRLFAALGGQLRSVGGTIRLSARRRARAARSAAHAGRRIPEREISIFKACKH